MLTENHIFCPDDQGGKTKVEFEVNWNPNDETTNTSKVVRLSCDGKAAYIKREDLMNFLFAIGLPEDQRKMIPQTLTKVRWYETVLGIKAKKDIRRGEEVRFAVKLSLPPIQDEIVGEIKRSQTKTNIPIIGK